MCGYILSISDDLSESPFELDLWWVPKTLIDFINCNEVLEQSWEDFKKKLKTSLELDQVFVHISKAKRAPHASRRYKPPEINKFQSYGLTDPFSEALITSKKSEEIGAKSFETLK